MASAITLPALSGQTKSAGIDACRKGWAVAFETEGKLHLEVWEDLRKLQTLRYERICIDMPVGLHPKRMLDQELRTLLRPVRHQTVFSVPVRKAVYSESYEEAKRINKEQTGKSISIQSWNICHRIKELDCFLEEYTDNEVIYECHPELCFFKLNGNQHMQFKKSVPPGVEERLQLLSSLDARVKPLFHETLRKTKRKDIKADDILDALCLNVSSRRPMLLIGNKPAEDDNGRKMRIAYPNKA